MIEVRDLYKSFDGFEAVRGVSFDVEEGDIFAFIGPNGAGKTTTIKMLATLLDPTSGTARIAGHLISEDPEGVRRLIGYMPDIFGTYDGLTVREHLDFFAAAYRIRKARRRSIIEEVMELTDLTGLADRMAETLSKGMRQRLCLAKTLVHEPLVLILDEPAAGLDPRARVELRELLKELRRLGKTILISSHILTELSEYCNAVGVIERGKVLACGPVKSITEKVLASRQLEIRFCLPENPDEAAVKGAQAAAELLLRDPNAIDAVAESDNATLRVSFQGGETSISGFNKTLLGAGFDVVGLTEPRRDLEEVFMRVTHGEVT